MNGLSLLRGLVQTERYNRAVNKVRRYRCSYIEPEDLVSEFNVGMLEAAKSVDLDRGDPMEYLISRGMWHVRRAIRKECNHNIIEECLVCGRVRPYRTEPCARCQSKNFLFHPRLLALVLTEDESVTVPQSMEARWSGLRGKACAKP